MLEGLTVDFALAVAHQTNTAGITVAFGHCAAVITLCLREQGLIVYDGLAAEAETCFNRLMKSVEDAVADGKPASQIIDFAKHLKR